LSKANKGVSSDADVHTFGAKNSKFFEIYGVSALTKGRGLSLFGYSADKGGSIFSLFCASVLYGRLLIQQWKK